MKNISAVLLAGMGLLAPITSQAIAITLEEAGDFNVLVFGDMDHHYSDIEGALAVGGNLTLSHYGIARQLGDSANHKDTLIVGGDLNFSHGRIYHGNARSGGIAVIDNVGFYDDDPNHPNGDYIPGNPLNFGQMENEIKQKSLQWGALEENGELRQACFQSGCDLILEGNQPLNIFTLESSLFDTLQGFYLDVPLDATILINVAGNLADISDFAFFRKIGTDFERIPDNLPEKSSRHDGSLTQDILFNFYEAETLKLHEIGMKGSILAPWADIAFYNGHLDGNLIGASLRGHPESDKCADTSIPDHLRFCAGQTNWYPFEPLTPSTPLTPIPEPPLLLLTGIFMIGLARRYSKAPNK